MDNIAVSKAFKTLQYGRACMERHIVSVSKLHIAHKTHAVNSYIVQLRAQ